MGSANPAGAARAILAIAAEEGVKDLSVAVVEGDDLLDVMTSTDVEAHPVVEGLEMGEELLAANVYLGAEPIAEALALGADIVVTGRCTDPALVLGPLLHEFDWDREDWDLLAKGTVAGHLLECGAQVGAYFADPGYKDVPDLARVGFPIAEIGRDGSVVVTKAENTGGLVSARTVKEQLLYEMHDPANYLTADVVLDISGVAVEEIGPDRVGRVTGARRKTETPDLESNGQFFDGGYLSEAEIMYRAERASPGPTAIGTCGSDTRCWGRTARSASTSCVPSAPMTATDQHCGRNGSGVLMATTGFASPPARSTRRRRTGFPTKCSASTAPARPPAAVSGNP